MLPQKSLFLTDPQVRSIQSSIVSSIISHISWFKDTIIITYMLCKQNVADDDSERTKWSKKTLTEKNVDVVLF